MPFFEMLPIVMCWQCFVFITRFIIVGKYKSEAPVFVISAYGSLAILFVSAFFGVVIGMSTDSRIWGAVILVAIKTIIALIVAYRQREQGPVTTA